MRKKKKTISYKVFRTLLDRPVNILVVILLLIIAPRLRDKVLWPFTAVKNNIVI